ncbi:hypothetical protein DERP_014391 [Dermatophagoides pteronyssinus]|uniref:Uncharacterized protein n=1 Tax=Dermatophagoides pteronyssinus TaxID=6956 RepID=A0ABQ8J5V3_DERPT|nr:hypothetical protein DERP_014391 [Dermatophagoides pteronyssinus]
MFSNNQIIPPSFHQLFPNISLCPNCTTDDWHIDFCQYIPIPSIISPTLFFKINAYMRSTQNIKYFGADPFTILIPDTNNFSLLNLENNKMYAETHLIIPENIVQIKHDEKFVYFYCLHSKCNLIRRSTTMLDSLVQTEHEMIERIAGNIFSYHQTKFIVIGFISVIIIIHVKTKFTESKKGQENLTPSNGSNFRPEFFPDSFDKQNLVHKFNNK